MFAVVMDVHVNGVSSCTVSQGCADLDQEVAMFWDRSLAEATYPYVFWDAT